MPEGEILNADDVARILGKDITTVYYWLRKGRLAGVKTGKSWHIEKADLEEFQANYPSRNSRAAGQTETQPLDDPPVSSDRELVDVFENVA